VAEKRQTGSIKFYRGWLDSKSVRYIDHRDHSHLETFGPLVVTSLCSVTSLVRNTEHSLTFNIIILLSICFIFTFDVMATSFKLNERKCVH